MEATATVNSAATVETDINNAKQSTRLENFLESIDIALYNNLYNAMSQAPIATNEIMAIPGKKKLRVAPEATGSSQIIESEK